MHRTAGMSMAAFAGAAMLGFLLMLGPSAHASVDDFSFESMSVNYQLGRDADGRSVLDTTETLVARFPEFNQNHGIVRAIPLDYLGHPTDLEIVTVSDVDGGALSYSVEESDGFAMVTIAADEFVHGATSYVIRYRQHNVILTTDSGQEFYWDVNGTGWSQPFATVTADLTLSTDLAASISGEPSCYRGAEGAIDVCTAEPTPLGARVSADGIGAGETVTLNLPVRAGTFTERDFGLTASPIGIVALAGLSLLLVLAIAVWLLRAIRWRNHRGRGIIVTEYALPDGLDVFELADLWNAPRRAAAALIAKLAVAGIAQLRESGRSGFELVRTEQPVLLGRRRTELRQLSPAEAEARDALFQAGATRKLSTPDPRLGTVLKQRTATARRATVQRGFRSTPDRGLRIFLGAMALLLVVTTAFGAVRSLGDGYGGPLPIGILAAAVLLLAAVARAGMVRPLTSTGRALRDHLAGLKLFLEVTESERLAALQGPSTAERDDAGRIDLYESLLPAAILLGVESQWSQTLGDLYAEARVEPDWFVGNVPFNVLMISSVVQQVASTSWATSSTSSSDSGSDGGGFAGGGGGGGGGGGV